MRIRDEGKHAMSNDPADVGMFDVATLEPCVIDAMGDSVLGHAVRRVTTHDRSACDHDAGDTVAAFDNHI